MFWDVCVARSRDKRVFCKISARGSESALVHLFLCRPPTSAVADAPLRPFLSCGCGVQRLDGAEVRDCVARLMTSQEPACLTFPSSDEGAVVLLLDTMLEATTGHLWRTKGKKPKAPNCSEDKKIQYLGFLENHAGSKTKEHRWCDFNWEL